MHACTHTHATHTHTRHCPLQTWDDAKKRAYDNWRDAQGTYGGAKGTAQGVSVGRTLDLLLLVWQQQQHQQHHC